MPGGLLAVIANVVVGKTNQKRHWQSALYQKIRRESALTTCAKRRFLLGKTRVNKVFAGFAKHINGQTSHRGALSARVSG